MEEKVIVMTLHSKGKQAEHSIVAVMDDMMFIDFSNLHCCSLVSSRARVGEISSGSRSAVLWKEKLLATWTSLIRKHWKHQSVIGLVRTANINIVIQPSSFDFYIGTKYIFNGFNWHLLRFRSAEPFQDSWNLYWPLWERHKVLESLIAKFLRTNLIWASRPQRVCPFGGRRKRSGD